MPATLERPTYPGGDIRHEDEAPDRPLTPIVASGPAHVLGHVRIACIVAAHNEEHGIAGTLESLWWQTRAPDLIIVAADRCSDDTLAVARACGADIVFETIGNHDRKAGALNQAISLVGSCDYVVQVDADVEVTPRFIERAVERMERDDRLGAVGAMATVREERGFLNLMQRMWFVRYSHIESR